MLAKGPGVNMSIDIKGTLRLHSEICFLYSFSIFLDIKGTGGDQSNNATQPDIFSIFLLFQTNKNLHFLGFQ